MLDACGTLTPPPKERFSAELVHEEEANKGNLAEIDALQLGFDQQNEIYQVRPRWPVGCIAPSSDALSPARLHRISSARPRPS